jgi:DNA-binding transcriptional MerR regulator/effector-binding domain-containing protein
MQVKLSIGDFSRMTHLTVKALRHYHEIGVLEPTEIDSSSGYRYYAPSQVAVAQTVRRLRDLGMPLDEIRVIVKEPDSAARDQVLVEHLERMEQQLRETQLTVASLRSLLQDRQVPPPATPRHIAATTSIAIEVVIRAEDAVAEWIPGFTAMHQWLAAGGATRAGTDGAIFAAEFFEDGIGGMTIFIPVDNVSSSIPLPARAAIVEIPAVDVAVLTHEGPFGDLDLAYGAVGTWVAERAINGDGPIREYYLPTGDPDDLLNHHTEVCWPISA